MILTVSLNPAVDKTCEIESLKPGEVNRLLQVESVPGGKAVNVTKVLRQFKLPVMAVGFLGGNAGKFIEEGLEAQGVLCCFTRIAGDTRTNSNVVAADGSVTELLEPGPEISEKELENFRKQFRGCLGQCEWVILSGSVPGGVPADIYRELIEECHAFGCRVILDSSGEALRQGILAKPDLVKPNQKELEYLAGKSLDTEEKIKKAMQQLCDKTGGEVVVSLGAEGLLALSAKQKNEFWKQAARQVEAVNTVGCGDTVVASLCMSRIAGEEPEIMLRKAAALAAANATTRENGIIPMETYLELL